MQCKQLVEENSYLQCPYDESHRILKLRMQTHLSRCRRNHLHVPKVICPFNVTHVLNGPELEYHLSTCVDRAGFEKYKHRDQPMFKPAPQPPAVFKEIKTSENWDDDPDVPSYDPQSHIANKPVVRALKGASRSEKKKFREEERKRFLRLQPSRSNYQTN